MSKYSTLLAIESATPISSVALLHEGKVYERRCDEPRKHSEQLLPLIQTLFDEAPIERAQLEGIAVGIGPGSFTGVRLAVGLAQSIGFALNLPIWPISTLKALAYQISQISKKMHCGPSTSILPVLDARMQAAYWGLYQNCDRSGVISLIDDQLSEPERVGLDCAFSEMVFLGGSGVEAYYDKMRVFDNTPHLCLPGLVPRARDLLALAQWDIAQGIAPVKPEEVLPHYIRDQVAHI